jgi:hypothetical protein
MISQPHYAGTLSEPDSLSISNQSFNTFHPNHRHAENEAGPCVRDQIFLSQFLNYTHVTREPRLFLISWYYAYSILEIFPHCLFYARTPQIGKLFRDSKIVNSFKFLSFVKLLSARDSPLTTHLFLIFIFLLIPLLADLAVLTRNLERRVPTYLFCPRSISVLQTTLHNYKPENIDNMSATAFFELPSLDLFQFPPSNDPLTLAPPSIPVEIYQAALDIRVPITIAIIYASVVTLLNKYNRSNGFKAWPVSKSSAFFVFVVIHNVLLAVYSGWTFVGMLRALVKTFANPFKTPGLSGTIDSLCKIHGTAGLSNSVTYNPTLYQWTSNAPNITKISSPSSADIGRFWNEGLAFYGWFFYLSKFYEVLDTLIILAKGKKSSTLQTYHHAGAMLCMWAGIRYMSPPIWMFVFVNSFIHTLMYTYYTLTAFAVPVPLVIKRSLTTIQIIQFLFGTTYAALHSFVGYSIPISVPISEVITSTVVPAATGVTSSLAAFATAAGLGGLLNKVMGQDILHASEEEYSTVTKWQTVQKNVSCIDTSGQTFAIWLNVLYLAPLTALFVRFFVKSYLKRAKSMH